MKMNVTATVSHALGHWPRILTALGIQVLKNRHQPCPVCGGSDRFRFDDREGRGTWYCNQCGAGDGLKLVEKVFGVSPSDAAAKVAAVTGSLPPADPAVTAAAGAETDAARKNAAALAQTLMAKTRPGTGNAYLTRKGRTKAAGFFHLRQLDTQTADVRQHLHPDIGVRRAASDA